MTTENITDQNLDSPESQDAPEVDWKTRAEATEAENAKLENALKSERGRRDQRLEEIEDHMGAFSAQLAAIGNRTATGDTEALTQDFAKINQDSVDKQATRNWTNNYSEAEQSLADALMDNDGNVIVDQDAVNSLSADWKVAQQSQDLHSLYRVVSRAHKEAKSAANLKAKENVTKVEEDAKAAKEVSNTKHGVNDLGIPAPSGGGGAKSRSQIEKATNVNDISDADYEKYVAG